MDFIPFLFTAVVLFFVLSCIIKICCTKTHRGVVISTTPVVITSETHRVAAPVATQGVPVGVIVQGHPTGSAAYPVAAPVLGPQHVPSPQFPAQPYIQSYPYQTSGVPPPLAQGPPSVQFPALPPQMSLPMPPTSATAPPSMANPPSYDQVVGESYSVQAPYNPDFKG
uniref:Uncharacterized protein n=1 Tax=Anopheles farauti TaxID=69004 RepID=A0A182QK46_9DIPT